MGWVPTIHGSPLLKCPELECRNCRRPFECSGGREVPHPEWGVVESRDVYQCPFCEGREVEVLEFRADPFEAFAAAAAEANARAA